MIVSRELKEAHPVPQKMRNNMLVSERYWSKISTSTVRRGTLIDYATFRNMYIISIGIDVLQSISHWFFAVFPSYSVPQNCKRVYLVYHEYPESYNGTLMGTKLNEGYGQKASLRFYNMIKFYLQYQEEVRGKTQCE